MDSSGCYCPSKLFINFLNSAFVDKKKVFRVRIIPIEFIIRITCEVKSNGCRTIS